MPSQGGALQAIGLNLPQVYINHTAIACDAIN